MAEFKGYLITSSLDNNNKPRSTINITPFMQYDTYQTTPNIVEDILAYRKENSRDLVREVAKGKKTTITFSTIALDLTKKMKLQQFFNDNMINESERKVQIIYWNDYENVYKTSAFYLPPELTFKILRIEENNIFYNPLEISLIEY